MKLGVRVKLFLISLGLIATSVFAGYTYLRSALEQSLLESVRNDLHVRARLVAREAGDATADSPEKWQLLAQDLGKRAEARVTLMRSDGTVFGDSDAVRSGAKKGRASSARRRSSGASAVTET